MPLEGCAVDQRRGVVATGDGHQSGTGKGLGSRLGVLIRHIVVLIAMDDQRGQAEPGQEPLAAA